MATLAELLTTQLNQVAERIVEVTASANPTVSVAGRQVGKTEYLATLRDTQRELMEQLQKAHLITSGPFEVRSYGR